jgi:uncharacterized repeat protein (TIGR04138 family)
MQDVTFEEAVALIRAKDPRYQADAYVFVREALDQTQQSIGKETRAHVSGQELLEGIRAYALQRYGPMAMLLLEEWGIHSCEDFGEIVFNMIESGASQAFAVGDLKDLRSLTAKLKEQSDPVSQFLWSRLSETSRRGLLRNANTKTFAEALVKELNTIIRAHPIYEESRFAGVSLSDRVRPLIHQKLCGPQLAVVNRLLLEEAYPVEIARSGGLLAKTEKDSRADFKQGYDFFEAFRKPFLPQDKQRKPQTGTAAKENGAD